MEAERYMTTRSVPTVTLATNAPLYKKIMDMVSLEVHRVQLYRLPKARRFPLDIPITHRALVAYDINGSLHIESESLKEVGFPRARFTVPLRFGIFIFGNAPELRTDASGDAPPVPDLDIDSDGYEVPKHDPNLSTVLGTQTKCGSKKSTVALLAW